MAILKEKSHGNSGPEDRFIELFCDAFGAEQGQYVYLQYPFVDIYGRHRNIDFAVNLPDGKVAIEIDGNTWHQPGVISTDKYHDDLLKQNSMVFEGWRVYRWTSNQIEKSPDRVKDELVTFLGRTPMFSYIDDALPPQRGEAIELMDHQEEALENLDMMRAEHKSRLPVLCACDLLNEGWDSPHTQVLFMARPTMSKTIYMQQLGRGMRKSPGKDYLMFFDFVDNTNVFNVACSIHRILGISEYVPGGLVLGPKHGVKMDMDMFRQGQKPEVLVDYPIHMTGYETIDLFNWQEKAKGMLSQIAFTQMVNVQSETIERYIREGKIKPDMEVPVGESRSFKFFEKKTVEKYAKEYGWTLITKENIKEIFFQMVNAMTMSYSYKPVFLLAFLDNMNEMGEAKLDDVSSSFAKFYEDRVEKGLPAEKKRCIFTKGSYSQHDVEKLILSMPFKRYEDMHIMHHSKQLGIIQFYRILAKQITEEDIEAIRESCNKAIQRYFMD